jgi:hypothetical protein
MCTIQTRNAWFFGLFGLFLVAALARAQIKEPPTVPNEGKAVSPSTAPSQTTPTQSQPTCTTDNLVAGSRAFAIGTRGDKNVVNDGRLAEEGSFWESANLALVLKDDQSNVIFDLGQVSDIRALVVQADNNDPYTVESSKDGVAYQPIWIAPATEIGLGLRTRYMSFAKPQTARYLRVNARGGDSYYSISEVRAYCKLPKVWPPRLILPPRKYGWSAIDNDVMAAVKGWLAVLGSLILLGTFVYRYGGNVWNRARRYPAIQRVHDALVKLKNSVPFVAWLVQPKILRRIRDVSLATVGFIAFISWWNIGHFHFDHYIHMWEHYHNYIGAKYGPELRYSRLYECTAVADLEDGLYTRVKERKMRNLLTNESGTTEAIIKEPMRCKSHFTAARWEEFRRDIRWFRARFSTERWNQTQDDHGYDSTPVWAILARVLTESSDITWTTTIKLKMFGYEKVVGKILVLGIIDSVLLVLMWGVVWWAFGWRATCVALLYWGCNFPARYYWNGGSFLRSDWLVWMVIGIALLKKEKMAIGGFALTYAALLRVFPGFVVVGLIAKAFYQMVKERRFFIFKPQLRFAAGCIAALLIFIPISSWATNGLDAWVDFAKNYHTRVSTPLTNNMGLKTVLGYNFATRAIKMQNFKLEDPFNRWKDARRYYYEARKPVFVALIILFLILLGKAGSKGKDWEVAALATGLIAVAAELNCYYYGFLLTYGLLWDKRKLPGTAACILAAVTCLFPAIWGWNDDHFGAMSLATVITIYAVVAQIAFEGQDWRGLGTRLRNSPTLKRLSVAKSATDK